MTGRKRAIALGRVILFGGCLGLSATAAAYGQQWRPASMPLAPGHSAAFGRIANSPSFRPRARLASNRFRQVEGQRHRTERRGAARVAAPRTPPVRPLPALPRGYGYPPGARTMPPWEAPFATMAQLWQPSGPTYRPFHGYNRAAPQYATRVQPQPRLQARPTPRMLGYRPATSGRQPLHADWRSASPVQDPTLQTGKDRLSHYTIRRQPVLRSNQVVASARRLDRPVGLSQTSMRAAQRSWRPTAAGGRLAAAPPPTAFRPVAYGRPAAPSGRLAATLRSDPVRGAGRYLPGWVTTLHDNDNADLCSWCGGS